jgi:hypothetical protein
MFRFTIRELVLLTLVVGLVVAWRLDHTRQTKRLASAELDARHDRWATQVMMQAMREDSGSEQRVAEMTSPTLITVHWRSSSGRGSTTVPYPKAYPQPIFGGGSYPSANIGPSSLKGGSVPTYPSLLEPEITDTEMDAVFGKDRKLAPKGIPFP